MNQSGWLGLIALASCSAPSADPSPPPSAPAPAPTLADGGIAPRWLIDVRSGALVHAAAVGRPVVSLTCSGPDSRMTVAVAAFRRIESEDRLTLGAGNEAFAFAADLEAPGPGIVASGAVPPDLLDRIERGETISAVYGNQRMEPLPGIPPAVSRSFVAGCRARSGQGPG